MQTHIATSEKRTDQLFWAFCLFHFVVWVAVPILTQPNAPLDTIEMLFWGHEWELGYYKHPPLPAWIAEGSTFFFPTAIWPTYVAAQLCTIACFWSAWTVLRSEYGARAAFIGAVILEGSYYYTYTTPEFNNNSVSRACWALTIAFLYKSVIQKREIYWLATGITLGLGMLAKYDTSLLALAMLIYSIMNKQARTAWKSWGPYGAIAVSLTLFAPHVFWLMENNYPTVDYFLKRSEYSTHEWSNHVLNPLRFLATQLFAWVPIVLLAGPALTWKLQWRKPASEEEQRTRNFIVIFTLLPITLVAALPLLTGCKMKSMWGAPLFTFTGALVVAMFQIRTTAPVIKSQLKLCLTMCCAAAIGLFIHDVPLATMTGILSRVHFPGRLLSKHVEEVYQQQIGGKPAIIAGPWWTAANVAFYAPSRPSVYSELNSEQSPWINDERFGTEGGVIIWREKDASQEFLQNLEKRFPNIVEVAPFELPAHTVGPLHTITFHTRLIPPNGGKIIQNAASRHAARD